MAVPKSKKLLQFTLDDGTGDRSHHPLRHPRTTTSRRSWWARTLVAITNLPPRKMMGIASCGMLLSAVHEEKVDDDPPRSV